MVAQMRISLNDLIPFFTIFYLFRYGFTFAASTYVRL